MIKCPHCNIDIIITVKKINIIKIQDLEITTRSLNCLLSEDINTVDDLSKKSIEDLSHINNLGKVNLTSIYYCMLYQAGIKLEIKTIYWQRIILSNSNADKFN